MVEEKGQLPCPLSFMQDAIGRNGPMIHDLFSHGAWMGMGSLNAEE